MGVYTCVCACLYRQVSKRVCTLRADSVQANPVSPDTEIVARTHCHCCREICQYTPCLSLPLTKSLHSCFIHAPSGKEKHKIRCLRVHMCVHLWAYVHIRYVCVHAHVPFWEKKKKNSPEEYILLLKMYWIINGQSFEGKKNMDSAIGLPFCIPNKHMQPCHTHLHTAQPESSATNDTVLSNTCLKQPGRSSTTDSHGAGWLLWC